MNTKAITKPAVSASAAPSTAKSVAPISSTAKTATAQATSTLKPVNSVVIVAAAKKQSAAKPVSKTAVVAEAKPSAATKSKAIKPAASPAKPVKKADKKTDKKEIKKAKLVRDSYTIPKSEFEVLDTLKARSINLGHAVKKSELLRAGIKLLQALSDSELKAAMQAVPAIATGRPAKKK